MEIKILFGSKMLGLQNPRDEDWRTFADETTSLVNCSSIKFFRNFISHFINGKNCPEDSFKSKSLYQLSSGFHTNIANYPFSDFNILEHKKVWIKQLKDYINLVETKDVALKKEILDKRFYHLLYQYYMIVENTHLLSEVAMAEIQKIHDYEMPSEFFYELHDRINNLSEE